MSRSPGDSSLDSRAANSAALILVPTPMERRILERAIATRLAALPFPILWRCCGVGPAIAGTVASRLLTQLQPTRVILVGIAGSLDPHLPIASVVTPAAVDLEGIGAWTQSLPSTPPFIATPGDLGWKLYEPHENDPAWNLEPPLSLVVPRGLSASPLPSSSSTQALTVCAAAGSPQMARERRSRFPQCILEEMEGFPVAAAAQIAGIPMTMIRGISNVAGDRQHTNWKIADALQASAQSLAQMLESLA